MIYENETEEAIEDLQVSVTELEAIRVLVGNNLLACEIHIAGMIYGLPQNKTLLPFIEQEILITQEQIRVLAEQQDEIRK